MITISHTHLDGTMLDGSSRGDGVYELIGPRTVHRFKWFPSIDRIGIPMSRDRVAQRYRINTAAEALRAAGHEVVVEIDDTPRDRATVLADQSDRLDDRHAALSAKATRRAGEADALWAHSDRLVEHIPPGQPILVGHHSERGHRRTLERSQNAAFKAVAVGREAREIGLRASAVGSSAAYAASPGATARRIERLQTELRDIDRKLTGYERRSLDGRGRVLYTERHEAAGGDYEARLRARREQIELELGYDRQQLAAAIAAGKFTAWSRETVHVGDEVSDRSGASATFRKVVKVNKVSVSVETGYSWLDKLRFVDIREVRCPHNTKGDS